MRSIAVFTLTEDVRDLRSLIESYGFSLACKKPDCVIVVGGDGTYLIAERKYPEIPKLLLRKDKVSQGNVHKVLRKIHSNKFVVKRSNKIEAFVNNKKLVAANDIIIRNADQRRALRFSVFASHNVHEADLIGDGVVVSTAFGSAAYFHSITGKKFDQGIGLAFNNTTNRKKGRILPDNCVIRIKIQRETAIITADNDNTMVKAKPGDVVIVKKSKQQAQTIKLL